MRRRKKKSSLDIPCRVQQAENSLESGKPFRAGWKEAERKTYPADVDSIPGLNCGGVHANESKCQGGEDLREHFGEVNRVRRIQLTLPASSSLGALYIHVAMTGSTKTI